jgi:hypothetical protein
VGEVFILSTQDCILDWPVFVESCNIKNIYKKLFHADGSSAIATKAVPIDEAFAPWTGPPAKEREGEKIR